MKKLLMASLLSLLSVTAFAQDLPLPAQERWLALNGGITCGSDNTLTTNVPAEFKAKSIVFTYMTTDYTLDNGKFVAGFFENGVECRYNLLVLSDNANFTITKVDSKAYAVNGGSTCEEGKAYIDSLFGFNNYTYARGTMAIQLAVADAAEVCGAGATTVGLYFKKALKPKID